MKARPFIIWIYLVVSLLGSASVWSEVTMGVFPRRPTAVTYKAFKPLADQIALRLKVKVRLVVPKNFEKFWEDVKARRYDIVHYNQYHYIKSHKEYGYRVIAVNEESGSKFIRGQISVHKDSSINTIADLKGKTILFGGGPRAMVSYIATTSLLKKAGLVANKDYKVEFAKNPPSALWATRQKISDASGSGEVVQCIKNVNTKISVKGFKLKAIAKSESFIHLAWAVKDTLTKDREKKIIYIMETLKDSEAGKLVLKAAGVTGFHRATDEEFIKVREVTKYVLGEDL